MCIDLSDLLNINFSTLFCHKTNKNLKMIFFNRMGLMNFCLSDARVIVEKDHLHYLLPSLKKFTIFMVFIIYFDKNLFLTHKIFIIAKKMSLFFLYILSLPSTRESTKTTVVQSIAITNRLQHANTVSIENVSSSWNKL